MLRRSQNVLAFPAAVALLAVAVILVGCNLVGPNRHSDAELAHYKQVAQTVEHPQLNTPPSEFAFAPEPRTIDHNAAPQQPQEWWELTLDEAIQLAVTRSTVLRDLGGTIVRNPDTMRTIMNPAAVASDARFGMEAALSEFDATLATSVTAEKNDRMINNFVASGGTRFFQQDLINFQSQVSKLGAAGTRMTLRGISIYDFNNASFNRFPSVWDTLVEAEFRQPILQGAGARFNRLAGPNAVPGFYNGVLIARVNTDISVADFEMGLRDLVSNVENAYWDLYFAYRDLDAKIQLRNAALDAWKRVKILVESDQASGQIEREVQARELYFRYEEEVQNALAGTLQLATTNNNGASGGSFRGVGGVLVSERRLRLAIGLPITDGRMIRPADEPTLARVNFEWAESSDDAIARRPELLKQRLVIKRREMEYVAARNFLLPRFDMLGRYRFRGLGKDLIGNQNLPFDPADPGNAFANSSLANLANGDFQEWQLGGEITMPVGFRRGWAGVRNAQVNLAREKAVLEEQERQVMHDLSNAVGDMQRAYQVMETSYNRRLAAQQNVEILRFRVQSSQPVSAEQLLESERRLAEADIQYHRALVEHMLAIKNVHFEKGTLLEYGRIQLAEQYSLGHNLPSRPQRQREEPTPADVNAAGPLPETLPPMPEASQSLNNTPITPIPPQGLQPPAMPPGGLPPLPPGPSPQYAPPPSPGEFVPPTAPQTNVEALPPLSMNGGLPPLPTSARRGEQFAPPSQPPVTQNVQPTMVPPPIIVAQQPKQEIAAPQSSVDTRPPLTMQSGLPPSPPVITTVPTFAPPPASASAPPQPTAGATPTLNLNRGLPPLPANLQWVPPPTVVPQSPPMAMPPAVNTQPAPPANAVSLPLNLNSELTMLPVSVQRIAQPPVEVPPAMPAAAAPTSAQPVPVNMGPPPLRIDAGLPPVPTSARIVPPTAESQLLPVTGPTPDAQSYRPSVQAFTIPTVAAPPPPVGIVIERSWYSGEEAARSVAPASALRSTPSERVQLIPATLPAPSQPATQPAVRLPDPDPLSRLPSPDPMQRLPQPTGTIMSWQRLPQP